MSYRSKVGIVKVDPLSLSAVEAECAVVSAIVGYGSCQLVLIEVGILSRYCVKNLKKNYHKYSVHVLHVLCLC